ncbi:MAG: 4Fe-4S dicluster domain-containing protein [Gammaproteobacteria bacterium]|nr:4Fe-4S dicluster domain-containing protein [Gammaproteobacteria bacterium]
MPRRQRIAYQPGADQLALFPAVSGNAINGLGDSARRRPRPVYWFDPETIAHGALQKYFYATSGRLSAGRAESTQDVAKRGPETLDEIAPATQQASPAQWAGRIKAFARAHEADLVGITAMHDEWVFEGHAVDGAWVVILGFAMDQRELATGPPREGDVRSADEVSRQYNRAARAAKALANHIRGRGYPADARTGPWAGDMIMIPAAIEAGLGQLGKHGSMINDEYGASFRLSAVTTDLPLVPDAPRDIGVDDFCTTCQVCSDLCPPDAIFPDKQMVRGDMKWYVDFDKCLPYFNDTLGCAICIAECPWSLPGVAPSLTRKLLRRRERKAGT